MNNKDNQQEDNLDTSIRFFRFMCWVMCAIVAVLYVSQVFLFYKVGNFDAMFYTGAALFWVGMFVFSEVTNRRFLDSQRQLTRGSLDGWGRALDTLAKAAARIRDLEKEKQALLAATLKVANTKKPRTRKIPVKSAKKTATKVVVKKKKK